ncbi:MAG: type II CRISPR RNA-guided endonuclease Cas9 [Acholeplasmataceae bacterium]
MKRKLILGIDVGIASVGWGIIDENDNIIKAGVRLFEEGKTKSNTDRRGFRGGRRVKSRRRNRINDMKDLLIENKIIPSRDYISPINPYKARKKGLTSKLTNDELASALLHLSKRRGSSLETAGADEGKVLSLLAKHDKELKDKYVVELQLERLSQGKIRDNENIYRTSDYLRELEKILSNQDLNTKFKETVIDIVTRRRHFSEGPGSLTSPTPYGRWRVVNHDLRNTIIKGFSSEERTRFGKESFTVEVDSIEYKVHKNGIITNKKPYNLIDLMRGKCSVYPDEFRAPKKAFSAMLQNLLNDLNNIRVINEENRRLTKEEKLKAIEVIKTNGRFSPNGPKGLLKLFNLELEDVTGLRIDNNDKELITEFKEYRDLLLLFQEFNTSLPDKLADDIAEILTKTQVITEREDDLRNRIKNEKLIAKIALLTGYNGYHSFSFKALYALNDEMIEQSLNQQEILTSTLSRETTTLSKLEFDETLILSTVARQAHREAIKVVNELIKEFGHFDRIVIETAREKNSEDARARIRRRNKHFEDQKKDALKLLTDAGYSDDNFYSNQTLLKLRLYNEQNCKCAYSGITIDLHKLITDPFAYDIDHILPRSITQDNSLNNKVLVLNEVNKSKKNRTPFAYFHSGDVKSSYPINSYEAYKESILGNVNYQKNAKKRANLLFEEDITKFDILDQFTNRNLVDTSYAARSLMTTLKNYFTSNNIETSVFTIRGKQTDLFRNIARTLWFQAHKDLDASINPFNKNRDIYYHHAVDALIIAGLSNQRTLAYLWNMQKHRKFDRVFNVDTAEVFNVDPTEDAQLIKFLQDLGNLKSNDFRYSWKIDTKLNRSFSDQTIYSTRVIDNEVRLIKVYRNIYEMKQDYLEKILYEPKNYESLLIYQHDNKSFQKIRQAYDQYKHEKFPLKIYMEAHGMIKKSPKGPIIKNLKYVESKLGSHVDISENYNSKNKVVLLQISPYRTDIYQNDKGSYKFVTIRYADFSKDRKGYYVNKALYNEKLLEKEIDKNYEFKFSLHRNEIVSITQIDKGKLYYRFIATSNDITNVCEVKSIDKKDEKTRVFVTVGRKTTRIEKFAVSPAGRISKVTKEVLQLVR